MCSCEFDFTWTWTQIHSFKCFCSFKISNTKYFPFMVNRNSQIPPHSIKLRYVYSTCSGSVNQRESIENHYNYERVDMVTGTSCYTTTMKFPAHCLFNLVMWFLFVASACCCRRWATRCSVWLLQTQEDRELRRNGWDGYKFTEWAQNQRKSSTSQPKDYHTHINTVTEASNVV